MGVKRFEDLIAWQKAVELAVWIYELTECKRTRYRRLVDQMTAAAVSVPSNVAEGFERDMMKDFCRFLAMAKGSGGELITQLHIAARIGCFRRRHGRGGDSSRARGEQARGIIADSNQETPCIV